MNQNNQDFRMKDVSVSDSPELPTLFDNQGRSIDAFNIPAKNARQKTRRRNRLVAITLIAVVIIATAVTVPVVLTKRKPTNRYQELYLPKGFSGTQLNGVLEGNRTAGKSYDRLVVFGSSYSDNGHDRDAAYASSLAPSGYWQHRFSDGPVWVEYLQEYLGPNVTHLNYAYAGATTNNSIHRTDRPDTGEQMAWYKEHDYRPDVKPIVAMFTTTNDITVTFKEFNNRTDQHYQDRTVAWSAITRSAQSLVNQLQALIPNDTSAIAPDFLIMPILPVEMAPTSSEIAEGLKTTMDVMREVTKEYNKILMEGAKGIARELGSRGTVYTYDVPSWFYRMLSYKEEYGLKSIDTAFTSNNSGSVEDFLWYDGLHLPTHMQKRLGRMAANIILDEEVMP